MTIAVSDIKILESQRLTDDEDGGGRATGKQIVSGDVNNLFNDISRLDRTTGRVSLRKVFTGVHTDNDDTYLGAHLIITKPPVDPNVSIVMFDTGSETDERKDARDRIESYTVKAAQAPLYLLGHQLTGQYSIVCVQNLTDPLPEIGDVYVLFEGSKEQYIKVQRVEHHVQVFVYEVGSGNFTNITMRQLTLDLSSGLNSDFTGGRVVPGGTGPIGGYGDPAKVLSTQVADAARYFGVSSLATDANIGDTVVNIKDLYSPIVPNAQQETPLVDQNAIPQRSDFVACGAARTLSITFAQTTGSTSEAYLTTSAVPGSVTFTLEGGTFVDAGDGRMLHDAGPNNFSSVSVDYATGKITAVRASSVYSGSTSATYTPAAPLTARVVSNKINITGANRQRNYTLNLAGAKPNRATLIIDFMALGKWYRLTDAGAGQLSGAGTGTINYDTGSVILTLDALPDAGTAIIYNYVTSGTNSLTIRTDEVETPEVQMTGTLSLPVDAVVIPGSVTFNWTADSTVKTATDNGAGQITGDATGWISYASGIWSLTIDRTPDAGTDITIDFSHGTSIKSTDAMSEDANGDFTFTIPGAPLLPGSVELRWSVDRLSADSYRYPNGKRNGVAIRDNGLGGFGSDSAYATGSTINYTTGQVTLKAALDYNFTRIEYGISLGIGIASEVTTVERETTTGAITYSAVASATSGTADSGVVNPSAITFDLIPAIVDPIVPGSVVFTWGADTYVDRAGLLYKNINTTTNAGILVGSIDYDYGTVSLDSWATGSADIINLIACATANDIGLALKSLYFRTPGAPLALGSLQMTAIQADTGAALTASADFNGNLTGGFTGTVDITNGIVDVTFTNAVLPDSIVFNCVVLTTIPLDAEITGLDPVRLPSDGRVAVFRQGDVVVMSHTQTTSVGTPTDGQVFNLGRANIAEITIVDSNGDALDPAQYTEDRATGTVTMANPVVLQKADTTPLVPPLIISDRIEHMSLLADAQINGDLTLLKPIPQLYPADETVVSSAVLHGDTRARLKNFFAQKTWSNNWQDSLVGDSPTANYNDVNYPPTVTNRGAITERWALIFTSSTTFNIAGEELGVIGSGSTLTQTAPINPETGVPYFILPADGWGVGWAINNVIRFNTAAALNPTWLIRVVVPGDGSTELDGIEIQARGDAD